MEENQKENEPQSEEQVLKCEKYSLRPRSILNRIETQERRKQQKQQQQQQEQEEPISPVKPKPSKKSSSRQRSRAPPLSKYRRKNANARERFRMKEINDGFEALRRAIPPFPAQKTDHKLTKITILRLAINYINALSDVLDSEDPGPETPTPTPPQPPPWTPQYLKTRRPVQSRTRTRLPQNASKTCWLSTRVTSVPMIS
ncbi:unnamed protein product [Darwinula stevensoni]|uniref:BHLH domain-containing protein n=1 Tax=Darwinula stevensoni TaxID=69355 RepID=A0A7R8X931_9CRUS|nr:unnamed protein product [Darwinula stevensoni]CAG0890683.1 unnamed protein product [Darwinula stevensoni]